MSSISAEAVPAGAVVLLKASGCHPATVPGSTLSPMVGVPVQSGPVNHVTRSRAAPVCVEVGSILNAPPKSYVPGAAVVHWVMPAAPMLPLADVAATRAAPRALSPSVPTHVAPQRPVSQPVVTSVV